MKRLILVISLFLTAGLCACGGKKKETPADGSTGLSYEQDLKGRTVKDTVQPNGAEDPEESEPPEEEEEPEKDSQKPGFWKQFALWGDDEDPEQEEPAQPEEEEEPAQPEEEEEPAQPEEEEPAQPEEEEEPAQPEEEEEPAQPEEEEPAQPDMTEEEPDSDDPDNDEEKKGGLLKAIGDLFLGRDNEDDTIPVITITVPAGIAQESSQKQLDEASGIEHQSATRNKDGSITYKMTEEQQAAKLDRILLDIQNQESKMSEKNESISEVSHNEDCSVFDVSLKGSEIDYSCRLEGNQLGQCGALYNAFNGAASVHVTVNFNAPDGSTLESIEIKGDGAD